MNRNHPTIIKVSISFGDWICQSKNNDHCRWLFYFTVNVKYLNDIIWIGAQPNTGMILTTPGFLRCKNILHVTGCNNPKDIQDCMTAALLLAEETQFTSISFPALGTGEMEHLMLIITTNIWSLSIIYSVIMELSLFFMFLILHDQILGLFLMSK